jgi:lipoate-protein ligase A
MPRLSHIRVIIDTKPQSGHWNMAADEVLLESAISSNVATLRWYRWNTATVSLGYFQKLDELANDPVLSGLPIVRRLSGGGAIVHDNELTYCLALPGTQTLFHQPHELYDIVHVAIATELGHLGFPVTVRGTDGKLADEPTLCFQRKNSHDVTLSQQKVLGSAQRRRRGAIMQHGSLLLKASAVAPEIPGLADLVNQKLPEDLIECLATGVARTVSQKWTFEPFTESEAISIKKVCQP